jgi:hypothetical protein
MVMLSEAVCGGLNGGLALASAGDAKSTDHLIPTLLQPLSFKPIETALSRLP